MQLAFTCTGIDIKQECNLMVFETFHVVQQQYLAITLGEFYQRLLQIHIQIAVIDINTLAIRHVFQLRISPSPVILPAAVYRNTR